MSSRHRPLLACSVSILAIADIAFRKTQDLKGPLGSSCRKIAKLAKFASPLIYAMQYQWLAILSFLDDQFLAVEKMIEKFYPSSSHVVDKIEEIVLMIVSLPEKFDDTVDKFPAIICQFSIIQWALVHLISWLNCLISTLNQWELEKSRMKEITIDIATNCNIQLGSESDSLYIIKDELKESFGSVSEYSPAENYKKVEKILEHIDDGDACEGVKEWQSEKIYGRECKGEEKDTDTDKESIVKFEDIGRSGIMQEDDPILQLFESKWLMTPVT